MKTQVHALAIAFGLFCAASGFAQPATTNALNAETTAATNAATTAKTNSTPAVAAKVNSPVVAPVAAPAPVAPVAAPDKISAGGGKHISNAFGKQPVSMRVLYRRDAADNVVWYVQASLDVDTGYKEETASNNLGGVLGVDLNANGVAWSVVKPDGNRLVVDSNAVRGFISLNLKGTE